MESTVKDHNSLQRRAELAPSTEEHGWGGALISTGWKRPDTFTVATSLAAGTTTFNPLIAIRPGYWEPAHFASSAATLDQLSGGHRGGRPAVLGEPLVGVAARIDHLQTLSADHDRDLPPLEFGLRITTLERDTTDQAWADV